MSEKKRAKKISNKGTNATKSKRRKEREGHSSEKVASGKRYWRACGRGGMGEKREWEKNEMGGKASIKEEEIIMESGIYVVVVCESKQIFCLGANRKSSPTRERMLATTTSELLLANRMRVG